MRHEITHAPAFALLKVDLAPGETIAAEAGAMVARSADLPMRVTLNAGRRGGLFGRLRALGVAFIRKLVGGETFFVNTYSARAPSSLWLAPVMSGGIERYQLTPGSTLVLSTGAYLASMGDVEMRMRFTGLRGLFAREGLFFLEMRGDGPVWFNSYGGIEYVEVDGSYIVENGHIVGFEGGLDFRIRGAGDGLKGIFFSGQGLVCEFQGRGRVCLKARSGSTLIGHLSRH